MSFNLEGYSWQVVNCGLTAGYHLMLRGAMDRVRFAQLLAFSNVEMRHIPLAAFRSTVPSMSVSSHSQDLTKN